MPTAAEILTTFPEFSTPPASQATYLALAENRTAAKAVWNDDDDLRALAVALLAAHMMTRLGLGSAAAASGAVSSESIGSLSVSYATPASEDELMTTAYGRSLIELRNENIMTVRTTYEG